MKRDKASKTPGSIKAARESSGHPAPSASARDAYAAWAVCAFLLLAVCLVFGQTVDYEFVNFDDPEYVTENPHVAHDPPLQGIVWAFTSNHASNWHPLTWLSHILDYQLYGLRPGGHHLTNVLLHAATAILLFLVLRSMTGCLWPSAFVAAVFALHPLRVESVAWISERKDVLSGLFFMLTLGAYLGYVRHPFSLVRYLTVIALFALGLMSKPMLVTLPFVLLLLDFWPLGRLAFPLAENGGSSILRRLIVEKVPLFALAAASCAATAWAQAHAVITTEYLPIGERFSNAVVSCAIYQRQFFYPANLAAYYPHWSNELTAWKVLAALLALAGITAGAAIRWRRNPYLLVGWLWYLGMLVPVIGLVQVGTQAMADRYTYLPQIGLSIALTWGILYAVRSWPQRTWACATAALLVLAALTACAWRQTTYWRDSEALWTRDLACTTENHIAHSNLGLVLARRGDNAKAIEHYRAALKVTPGSEIIHYNLGLAYKNLRRFDEAIMEFQGALKLRPDFVKAHFDLSKLLAKQGRIDEAIVHLERVVQLEPDRFAEHSDLGLLLASRGRMDEAEKQYRMALEIKPDFAAAHFNYGIALAKRRKFDAALKEFQKALDLARRQNDREFADTVLARMRRYENETGP